MIRQTAQWLAVLGATTLLWLHVAKVPSVQVDQTAVLLLGVLLAVPLIGAIKKLKYGDAEAEIEPSEVAGVARKVEQGLARSEGLPKATLTLQPSGVADLDLVELTRQDPVLGLAKLRIELEVRLRRLCQAANLPVERIWVGGMLRNLEKAGAIPHPLAGAIRDILPLANSAVHGAQIRAEDATRLAELGVRVLREIDA